MHICTPKMTKFNYFPPKGNIGTTEGHGNKSSEQQKPDEG